MDLKTLTEINAPSGHEQAIRRFLLDELKKLGFAPVLGRMGNVVVVKEGTGDAPRKRVMVSAHMDEVGLIVTSATEDGYLRIAAAGGIDPRVLVSKRVTVGEDKLPGVIGAVPIHLQSAAERKHVLSMDELLVDIGAKNKDEAECKAPMGTYISFDTPYVEYGDGFACGKAFDDRVGCLSLLRLLQEELPVDLVACFVSEEEVGCRGAKGQRSSRNPTSALCWKAQRATTSATYRRLRTSAKPGMASRCRSWMARQLRTERYSARRWTWRSRRTFRIR